MSIAGLRSNGVIAAAGLDLVAFFAFDLDLAEGAVELGIGGGVTDAVLRTQFGGNLVESLLELVHLVPGVDHASAGFGAELLHLRVPVVAAAVKAAVGDQDDVADGVSFLRRLDGVLDLELATLVLAV